MKTSRIFLAKYKFQSLHYLWENVSEKLSWSQSSALRFWLLSVAFLRSHLKTAHRLVIRGWNVGRNNILVTYNESTTNKRVFAGLVLLTGVAPIMYWAHLFFICPEIPHPFAFISDPVREGWHYKRVYYWLFTNREEFLFGIGLSGYFLIHPQKSGYKYLLLLLIVPCYVEIIFQSLQITSWESFYTPLWSVERGWQIAAFVLGAGVAVYQFMNYMVYRKYHLKDGNIARTHGIIKAPNIPAEQKLDILQQLVKESENFNARI
jgi:hypothetical protein